MNKEKIKYCIEKIQEQASYLEKLKSFADEALENKPSMITCHGGYPFLYGFVTSGCSTSAKEINRQIDELKKELALWNE